MNTTELDMDLILDQNISTQEVMEQASDLVDAFERDDDEACWQKLQEIINLSNNIETSSEPERPNESSDSLLDAFENELTNYAMKSKDELDNYEASILDNDRNYLAESLYLSPIDIMYNPRFISELYSPNSISRSTSPESVFNDDSDQLLSQRSDIFCCTIPEFDRRNAEEIHKRESLKNTIDIYQTSQGNSQLSQSQKLIAEVVDVKNETVENEVIEAIVDHVYDNESVNEKEMELDDLEPELVETMQAEPQAKRKRKSSIGKDDKVKSVIKRNHNKEAAKRYRKKKKDEFETDKVIKARLMKRNENAMAEITRKLVERKLLIDLIRDNFPNSRLPHIPFD